MDFFEESRYIESKRKFDVGKMWLKIVASKSQTKDYIKSIESKFHEIEDYGEKLLFWKDNNLSPLKLQYEFIIYDENGTEFKPVISILPEKNKEKLQYLNWIIEECYQEYSNNSEKYNFDTPQFEILKKRFFESKESREKFIRFEENSTKDRIKKTGVSTDVYNYIKFKEREPNVLSDLNFIDVIIPITLQNYAIELSFVYDYIKYLIFLKSQNKKEITVDEVFSENKTFNSTYDIPKLMNIHSLLEERNIIQKMDFEDFKLIFTESHLKDIKSKIVWLPKSTQGVDWDSLVIFLKNICGFSDTYFNNTTITLLTERIGRCFKSGNEYETGFNYSNSVPRSIRRLRKNNFKPNRTNKTYQKIESIFSKIF
ncbi:hypothetical protein N6B72_13855 [Chryseobacterium soli]|uniref:hypothetical protein n=1 Tax=Chryseobacterium soli TaxID=445961 RepID=UPI002953DCFC|nr:hypothetical protein [Chryseobacterium soli]MDV7698006.1 hypothetical protein [Chryseobacterium soli]